MRQTDDPIGRWDVALAAEVERLRCLDDPGLPVHEERGPTLRSDGHLRRQAVCNLAERDPDMHEAYLAEFNARGIGSRERNNKARRDAS